MLADYTWTIIDVETGGLSPEKNPVLEIACLTLDCNLEEVGTYESLIKPYGGLEIQKQALEANGLTLDLLEREGKDASLVCNEFLKYLDSHKKPRKKTILVGHNLKGFDMGMLTAFCNFHKKDLYSVIEKHTEDTMWESRKKWGHIEVDNHTLGGACQRANIQLLNAHRAMNDVKATAELWKYFVNLTRGSGVSTEQKKRFRDTFKF